MTVRSVLSIGHPALRVAAAAVPPSEISSDRVQAIVDDLIDTMRHANGAGLAANQIGETARIVVIEVHDNPRYPYKPPIPLTVAINPELEVLDGETVVINEGCLSVPLRGDVVRWVNLRVTAGGAAALGRSDVGRIIAGGPPHLTILDAPSRHHLAYRPGVPLIWRTLGADYRLPPAGDQTQPRIHQEET